MTDNIKFYPFIDLPNITEVSEFTTTVKLLTTDTPVLGYDGTDIGPSNQQAQALANRTKWLKDRLAEVEVATPVVTSVNTQKGDVVLTSDDVGADSAGTADKLMTGHLAETDPHTQYLNEMRGDARYVLISLANQPKGWLQLDSSGKIPAEMLQILAARYVAVEDKAGRLALSTSPNLTICIQLDLNQIFYLNANDDPSVEANWASGESATGSGVSAVFGRSGMVVAESGDYDADKITETATRKFVTPTEKETWNAKQPPLVSGTNIRLLFGQSLLGSGNVTLTPDQMGAAAKVHTHITTDITDYVEKTQDLIIASLEPGQGVTLGKNPVTGKTIISATGESTEGGKDYIVVERLNATAGQNHSFTFKAQNKYNLAAYALKEVNGATNQTYVIDDFNASSEPNYTLTSATSFDGAVNVYVGEKITLTSNGDAYSAAVPADGKSINISYVKESVVPPMTSNTEPTGYVASASEMSRPQFQPYLAFDNNNESADNAYDCWGTLSAPTAANPHWIRIDLPIQATITAYDFANRTNVYSNGPKDWSLQGSNDDGETWDTLHTVTNDVNNTLGAVRGYTVSSPGPYRSYRLLLTGVSNNNNWVSLKKFNLYESVQLLINGNNKWYTAANGTLTEVTASDYSKGFTESGEITNATISSLLPITVFSSAQTDIQTRYTPYSQIVIQKVPLSAAAWGQINFATMTATQTNNGAVRVAVSRDLSTWSVWKSGAWVDIGALTTDTAGAEKLVTNGISPTDLNNINAAGWTQFFSANNNVPDYIAFAFALDITDPLADVAAIDQLTLNVNEVSRWVVQAPTQVEISWRADSVTFRTIAAGNYKLAYQIP